MAFPLPDIETGEGGNYIIDAADPINFIGFEVTVDGKTVTPSVQARASSLGVDITALLLKHHLPLTTIMASILAKGRQATRWDTEFKMNEPQIGIGRTFQGLPGR